jgi:hypothetical protein
MKYLLLLILLASCSVANEPQTIIKGKNHRLIKGNAKHFQQRADADSVRLSKKY